MAKTEKKEKFKLSNIKISLPHVIQLFVVIIPLWFAVTAGWHKIEHLIKQVEMLNKNIKACLEPESD